MSNDVSAESLLLIRDGMEPDDLLCSRNARPPKDVMGNLVVLLLAERAPSEGPRSTRAIEDQPGRPMKRDTSELGGTVCNRAHSTPAVKASLGYSPNRSVAARCLVYLV
jgi:hypothetical protein